ncbi:MAG: hypothetical protein R2852_09085 [Bacteroidia bacterium]
MGILKSGKSFLPLNTGTPNSKLQQVILETGVKYIFSSDEFLPFYNGLNLQHYTNGFSKDTNINPIESPYAYLVYTSGSSNKIKGVRIKHDSILNYILNSIELL